MTEAERKEKFAEIESLAKQGDAEGLFKLGCYYYQGLVVEQDIVKAAELHLKAIENGYSEVCYEKQEETFKPTFEQLVEIYKQASEWRIRRDYYHYHEYYAGSGDDYSYGGIDDYCIFSPYHDFVKKVILDKDNKFIGLSISARVYVGSVTPTFFVDGTIKGRNSYDESCSRMDGPEDWGHRDKYTLVKKQDK